MTQLSTIAFRVVPSPDINDHEARTFIEGNDFLSTTGARHEGHGS